MFFQRVMLRRRALLHVLTTFPPPDQDDWLGEFIGGQEYALLWKEGEVYLLPFSEEDIGFYKAPGESKQQQQQQCDLR